MKTNTDRYHGYRFPLEIISHGVWLYREIMPSVDHNTERYANNLAEVSHQPTRQRERQMRGFKSAGQAQRFLSVHGVIRNLFNLGRHQPSSANYHLLRERSFKEWSAAKVT